MEAVTCAWPCPGAQAVTEDTALLWALCSALRGFKPHPKCTYHQHRKISIFLLQNSLLLLEIARCSKGQGQKEVSSIPRGS